jgi:hypothetical protein
MNKFFISDLVIVSLIGLCSCAQWQEQAMTNERPTKKTSGWQTQTLSEDAPFKHDVYVKSMPAEQRWDDLVITNFKKENSQWKISHSNKMSGIVKDSVYALMLNNVGPDYEEFTLSFPPTSFANIKYVSLIAACDGIVPPYIRIDIIDKNGYSTNFKPSSAKIVPSEEFYEYKFNYNTKYIQSWPSSQKVDSSNIVMIKMNFNPPYMTNNTPYSGEVLFKELRLKPFPKKKEN